MPIFGVISVVGFLINEDSHFLVPPKILVASLSSGSEILPSLGVGGILFDSDMLVDGGLVLGEEVPSIPGS
jgi:hypothetical protein